jgi:hypothetical protein
MGNNNNDTLACLELASPGSPNIYPNLDCKGIGGA